MNKWIAVLTTMVASLGIAGAATASTVKYDYDRKVEFSIWKRVAWVGPAAPGASFTDERIERAIEDGFKAKGYVFVESPADADFLIDWKATAWRDVQLSESFQGRFGRDVRLDRTAMGTLVIDVIDRGTGRLAWRGMVSDALASDPQKADKKTARAIARLLEKFPPEEKR